MLVALASVCWACEDTAPHASDAGGVDAPADASHAPACPPPCPSLCSFLASCGALPGGPDACARACAGDADGGAPRLTDCQLAAACAGSCAAYAACSAGPPDLAVDGFTAEVREGSGGWNITYRVTVCNRRGDAAAASRASVFHGLGAPPAPDAFGTGSAEIGALTPGACATAEVRLEAVAPGAYLAWARADAGGAVAEAEEGNNDAGPIVVVARGTACEHVCATVASCRLWPGEECVGRCTALSEARRTCAVGALAGRDCAALERCLGAPLAAPDLVAGAHVTGVRGLDVALDLTLCNRGDAPAPATAIDLFGWDAAGERRPAPGERGSASVPVASLAAGECARDLRAVWTAPGGGRYRVWALADAARLVAELDEENNFAEAGEAETYLPAEGPNLVARALTAEAPSAVNFDGHVCNIGRRPVSDVVVGVYVDRAPRLHEPPSVEALVPGRLDPGGCQFFHATYAPPADGEIQGWALVDWDDRIAESDESDNATGPASAVIRRRPDLEMVLGQATCTGPTISYRFYLVNSGLGPATGIRLGYWIDHRASGPPPPGAVPDVLVDVPDIAPLSHAYVNHSRTGSSSFRGWVRVDPEQRIDETNERNNDYGPFSCDVVPPAHDVYVRELHGYPHADGATWGIEVCKHSRAAETFRVGVYFDRPGPPEPGARPDEDLRVAAGSGFGSGDCQPLAVSQARLAAGVHTAWAIADWDRAIEEDDEDNNRLGPVSLAVSEPLGADLEVTDLTAAVNANVVTYAATVCNRGRSAAGPSTVGFFADAAAVPAAGASADAAREVSGLGPGACATRYHARATTGGRLQSWARADLAGTVAEADESDNDRGPVAVVAEAPPPPRPGIDLTVPSATATVLDRAVRYDALVCNRGTAPALGATVDLYYHRAAAPGAREAGEARELSLVVPAGTCRELGLTRSEVPLGAYRSWIQADTMGIVPEADEANNLAGPVVAAVGPDLVARSLEGYASGNAFFVHFLSEVCNQGGSPAPAWTLDLQRTAFPRLTYREGVPVAVPALGPAACALVSVVHAGTPPYGRAGGWADECPCDVSVYADQPGEVAELDETNNSFGPVRIDRPPYPRW